jgi:peptidoglycan/xylan/chitin deacetylase (PgdA/CDA1 family)
VSRDVLNLVFHGLTEGPRPENDPWWLEADGFRAALDDLAHRDDVCITFDDGLSSDVEIALPALLERSLAGMFFVTTDWVGRRGHLGPEHIRELVGAGMVVGSHGTSHTRWTELSAAELDRELAASRARLEDEANVAVEFAACPHGAYSRRVIAAVRRAGYERLYTTNEGLARRGAWLQPRTLVYPDMVGPQGFRIPGPPRLKRRARQLLMRWQ